eukprot:5940896-Amphidinium_carterae.1
MDGTANTKMTERKTNVARSPQHQQQQRFGTYKLELPILNAGQATTDVLDSCIVDSWECKFSASTRELLKKTLEESFPVLVLRPFVGAL